MKFKSFDRCMQWWKSEISPLPRKVKFGFIICLCSGFAISSGGNAVFSQLKNYLTLQLVEEEVAEKEQRIAVTAGEVLARDISQIFSVYGHIKPLKEAQAASDNGVVVTQVYVKWGQKVKRGQPLFQVDSRVHQLKSQLREMEGRIQQQEFEVLKNLAEKEIISKNEFFQKKKEIESAQIRNQIAKLESGAGKILSPIDGVVAEIKLKPGDFVDDPQKFFIKVVDLTELRFETWVPLDIAARLKVSDKVDFEWKKPAARPGEDDQSEIEVGEIDGISPMIDSQSGTVMVTVAIKELFNDWRSGIYVKASFPMEKKQKTLAIRNSSLIYDKGQPYAYRVIASEGESLSQVEKVPVKLGITDGEYSEILEGLDKSEIVVEKGVGTVNTETPVEIVKD